MSDDNVTDFPNIERIKAESLTEVILAIADAMVENAENQQDALIDVFGQIEVAKAVITRNLGEE